MSAPANPEGDVPVLRIRELTVALPPGADRAHAVEDIDLDVHAGEILCVVGESGSGKSVTAQAVMGLLPRGQLRPVGGEILLQGEDLLAAPRARLRGLRGSRMAMIFQEPMTALNPVMSIGRQIAEALTAHIRLTPRARRARVLSLMESVRLAAPEHLYKAYPHQISGGQRQRVMIAMALALEPVLLIADEPTTALDVTTQARILALIREIQAARDTGVLFITHDFGVVAEIADRVAVMQSGRIVETGDAHQILSQPEHPYTRMLIGAVPSLAPAPRDTDDGAPVVLSTEGLSKTYSGHGLLRRQREVVAAKGVSIQVRRGQTLGIVGESGSGKSTVARCVMRLTDPTGGDISLGGSDFGRLGARALWAARKRVQIVFQDPYRSLNPRRTIGRSMTEGPINYGMARAEARARALELLALVGIERGAIDRYPHQFSGGQRQRICIARALALEPELLVADEPVSALDVSVQAQVLRLLDDVRRRYHLGMLFITHDLRVAAQVCDTVAVMLAGEIVEHGPVAEVFERPSHDYTRRLLAAAPGRAWNFGASGVRE